MLIQLGNQQTVQPGLDDQPKITTVHVPEADEYGLGGYTHTPAALQPTDLKAHLMDTISDAGVTHLPEHEILVSVLHPYRGAWGYHGQAKPTWVHVIDHATLHGPAPERGPEEGPRAGVVAPHSPEVTRDIEAFLSEFWDVPTAAQHFGASDAEELRVKKELTHWTSTAPGVLPGGLGLPDARATFVNTGRVISNVNDGGGATGLIGVGTAATGTTLTTTSTLTTNAIAGQRIVTYSTTANNMVWGNVLSNTNAAGASVITVDRWYTFATPGGSAGTTPTTPWAWSVLDGGFTSAWFVGLATGANAAVATDTSLSTNGNVEIVTAGGGLIRKIAPYAQTSGVASRSYTLTPVYTANGSDSLPATVTTMGAFVSMVVGAAGTMKFETALSASATLSALGDQVTVTETVTGS